MIWNADDTTALYYICKCNDKKFQFDWSFVETLYFVLFLTHRNGQSRMTNTTALHAKHLEAGAKMVDFFGWDMPINYGSQIEEHHAVRKDAGMFDVSHMTIVEIKGSEAKPYLQYLLANY